MTTLPKRNCLYLFFMWRTFIPWRQTYLKLARSPHPWIPHLSVVRKSSGCHKGWKVFFIVTCDVFKKALRFPSFNLRGRTIFHWEQQILLSFVYIALDLTASHSHGQFINIRYLLLKIICAYSRSSFPWRAPREAQTLFIDVTELFHVSYNGID